METRKLKKLLIPSFALLIGGSLVATVSSTLAWFQYATRAQVAYVGALSHCSKLLKISINNTNVWGNEFSPTYMADKIAGNELYPITTGVQAKDAALSTFYRQPDLGRGAYTNWLPATSTNYAQFTIKVKVNDVNTTPTALVNDVYITKLLIADDSNNGSGVDLSDAVRVHLAVTGANGDKSYFLFAKSVTKTIVGGYLDLNNNGEYDLDFDSFGGDYCMYGTENGEQTSYLADDTNVIATEDATDDALLSGGTSLGKTGTNPMTIVVTTWIEGWSKLDNGLTGNANGATDTQIWDPEVYVNKKFNVGIRLGVKSHATDHQS